MIDESTIEKRGRNNKGKEGNLSHQMKAVQNRKKLA